MVAVARGSLCELRAAQNPAYRPVRQFYVFSIAYGVFVAIVTPLRQNHPLSRSILAPRIEWLLRVDLTECAT
jgi:hypothetical protein